MKTNGKTSEEAENGASKQAFKIGILMTWLVIKVLVDKIMLVLPEAIQDNGYYFAQSAWLFVLFILIMNYCSNLLFTLTALCMVIYQAVDLFTELYLLLGLMNLENASAFMFLASLLTVALLCVLLISKFYDGSTSPNK